MAIANWLDKLATVYAPADDYQAAVKTGLSCGLFHIAEVGAATGSDRAELLARRRLLWDGSYATMPEEAQVEIDGQRWQLPRGGGIAMIYDRNDRVPAYGRAEVLMVV